MYTSYYHVLDNHVFSIYIFYLRIIIYGSVIETNQKVYVSKRILTKSALQAKRNKKNQMRQNIRGVRWVINVGSVKDREMVCMRRRFSSWPHTELTSSNSTHI